MSSQGLAFGTAAATYLDYQPAVDLLVGWLQPFCHEEHRLSRYRYPRAFLFVARAGDGRIVWRREHANLPWLYPTGNRTRLSPDGRYCAQAFLAGCTTARNEPPVPIGVARLFDLATDTARDLVSATVPGLEGKATWLTGLKFSRDGRHLLGAVRVGDDDERSQRISWSLPDAVLSRGWPGLEEHGEVNPAGTLAVRVEDDGQLLRWRGAKAGTLLLDQEVSSLTWLDDHVVALLGHREATVTCFDVVRRKRLQRIALPDDPELRMGGQPGPKLVVNRGHDRLWVYYWRSSAPGRRIERLSLVSIGGPLAGAPVVREHACGIPRCDSLELLWDPGREALITAGMEDGTVRWWSAAAEAGAAPARGRRKPPRPLTEPVHRLRFALPAVEALAASRDGSLVAAAAAYGVEVHARGGPTRVLKEQRAPFVALLVAPDGAAAFCAVTRTVRRVVADPEARVISFQRHKQEVRALAIDGAGDLLVSGDRAGVIVGWDARQGEVRWQEQAHCAAIRSLALARAGRATTLASLDETGAVWTWTLEAGGARRGATASVGPETLAVDWVTAGGAPVLALLRPDGIAWLALPAAEPRLAPVGDAPLCSWARDPAQTRWAVGDQAGRVFLVGRDAPPRLLSQGHVSAIRCLAFAAGGAQVLVGATLGDDQDRTVVAVPL